MKKIKWIVWGLVGIVAIAVTSFGLLLWAVERGEYRQVILNTINQHVAREVRIDGSFDISIFPWVGFSIGQLSVANIDSLSEQPLVQVGSANIKVQLLPLLRRQLVIDTIQLFGLAVDLQRDANGVENWRDLIEPSASSQLDDAPSDSDAGETSENPTSTNTPPLQISIQGIEIDNSRVRWRDQRQNLDVSLNRLNFNTGEIKPGVFFPLQLSLQVQDNLRPGKLLLEISGETRLDLDQQQYQVKNLHLKSRLDNPELPDQGLRIDWRSNVEADLQQQKVDIDGIEGVIANMVFDGDIMLEQLNTSPSVKSTLSIQANDLQATFAALGVAAPVTQNPVALGNFSAKFNIDAGLEQINVAIPLLRLDATTLEGRAGVVLGDKPNIDFDLTLDTLSLDDYLAPEPVPTPENTRRSATNRAYSTGDQVIVIPFDALGLLNASGQITARRLTVKNLLLQELVLPLSVNDSAVNIQGMTAKFYRGLLDLDASIKPAPGNRQHASIAAKANLLNVEIEPLLTDFLGKALLSGSGSARIDVRTQGNSIDRFKSSLSGDIALSLSGGAIKGINIARKLREAKAKIDGQDDRVDTGDRQTDFVQMGLSGRVTEGVLFNDDLDMRSPILHITGSGQADLKRDHLDYLALVSLAKDKTAQGVDSDVLKSYQFPLTIQGPFDDLSVDYRAAIKNGLKNGAQAQADQLKKKSEDRLRQEKQKLKKQAEDKLKDSLKKLLQ